MASISDFVCLSLSTQMHMASPLRGQLFFALTVNGQCTCSEVCQEVQM